ncbi:hypothetical protein GOODEAATRI_006541 [Goodea atripinnis]|uniref:Uncharacterized protein n=1 Tax=Goodea atripinnis TaxID=208336 RepID=A0ABV0MST8_9TELE
MGKSVIYWRLGLNFQEGLIFESRRVYPSLGQLAVLWRVPAKVWGSVNDTAVGQLHSKTSVSAILFGVHKPGSRFSGPKGTETSMTNTATTHRTQTSDCVTRRNTETNTPPNLEVLSIKGQRAADQRVEYDPQAPDIHFRSIVLFALEELWSRVGRGAAESVQLVPQRELVTEAKICYLDVHICVQQ